MDDLELTAEFENDDIELEVVFDTNVTVSPIPTIAYGGPDFLE